MREYFDEKNNGGLKLKLSYCARDYGGFVSLSSLPQTFSAHLYQIIDLSSTNSENGLLEPESLDHTSLLFKIRLLTEMEYTPSEFKS